MSEDKHKNLEDLPKNVQEGINKQISNAFLHEQIKEDILTNPKYDSFFQKYSKNSRELFADTYKWKKANWIEYGEIYIRNEEESVLKYNNISEECLWQIQQKKLFNLQCEWRAEKIKIPEIRVTWDFNVWEKDIKNCHFIEPVSEEEIELYKDYLLCEDFEKDLTDYLLDWQDYSEFKGAYENDDAELTYPEWYQFYDNRMGTGHLLSLPDVRGEKEEHYRSVHFAEEKRKRDIEIEIQKKNGTYKETVPDMRPYMGAYSQYLEEFVNLFEDEKIKRFYRAYEQTTLSSEDDEELDEAINTLLNANEKIPIEGWHDWREAVIRTANKYERRKIFDYMDSAYKNYLDRINMGISYEKAQIKHDTALSEMIIDQILKGRKLNGEPEDLNY